MRNVRQSNINIHKDAWVEINLEYLAENIQEIFVPACAENVQVKSS